eukprot:CAMPEP_0202002230 /NCGR_PEP_ID=MMETSP0905-20130828/8118_1 /ASSEMBLY_ACC=CAM_ASM_000554 /TAXON_ID=420261 /ORGANISM="Thalassiosira antarctica, Strain CCMP982" /LENGTH=552 /DNA_ID=CAMNT_0048559073 /DNA_START=67 /DNA_END=1721 /DNA_ORIENTATION=+
MKVATQLHSRSHLSLPFILFLFTTFNLCVGTKHSFTTRNDARHFIGLGAPFGFLTGGVYNLTVFDFQLTVGKQSRHSENDGRDALQYVEAGFLLKRFDSESDFTKYHETVMEKPSLCVFESHRSKDYVSIDPSNIDDDLLDADDRFEVKYDKNDGGHHLKDVSTGGVFLSMNQPEKSWKPHTASIAYSFKHQQDAGLYFLIFQLCPRDIENKGIEIRTSFELDLHFKNYDSFGNPSYLTAGEMKLPGMYLYFSISYALCFLLWASNIRNIRLGRDPIWTSPGRVSSRPSVHAIHHLMTLLLGLKTVTVFFEALRYHYIRIHGHAEFLSAVYLFMSFVKGIFMFTVILLIGSGWSLVKPVLGDREKKIIWLVLVLQVIDNIAVAVLSQETEGEKLYEDWSALLHLVDILCCCAVLVPIVWQVNSLEIVVQAEAESSNPSSEGNGDTNKSTAITDVESENPATAEAGRTLQKLKQFQRFYILVVVYIYFTRIVVYLFATMLGYRQTWLRYFVTELGTLVFYSVVGFLFRPMDDNPYFEAQRNALEAEEIEFSST